MIGVIVVANRVGGFSHFDRADLDLFESLAHSVSVVLERGTLEQSLQQLRELEAALRHQANHDPAHLPRQPGHLATRLLAEGGHVLGGAPAREAAVAPGPRIVAFPA